MKEPRRCRAVLGNHDLATFGAVEEPFVRILRAILCARRRRDNVAVAVEQEQVIIIDGSAERVGPEQRDKTV